MSAAAVPPADLFAVSDAARDLDEAAARVPPHELLTEQSVLGTVLVDGADMRHVAELRPEHFMGSHEYIFAACRAIEDQGLEVTLAAVHAELHARGRLQQVGGLDALTELTTRHQLLNGKALREAAERLRQLWRARQLIGMGQRVAAQGYAGTDAAALVSSVNADLAALAVGGEGAIDRRLADRLATVDAVWLSETPPAREYLAIDTRTGRGALIAHGVALLVAAGGTGKSFATISLALAVATSTPWVGCMRIDRPGRVLVVSAEEPCDEVRRRLYHVARAARVEDLATGAIELLDLHDAVCPLLDADGQVTEHAAALVQLVRARGPFALVVVDPLARLAGGSIDGNNGAAGALVSVLEQVATAAGGLVVGIHHTSLTARRNGTLDATAIRGATGLGDSARLVLLLTVEEIDHGDEDVSARLGEVISLRVVKANHVRPWDPVELRRGEHGELLPLDAPDRDMVGRARVAADPKAAREGERTAREAVEDAAVRRAVVESPGITTRDLERRVRAIAPCGSDRAQVAIARVLPTLVVQSGARGARLHFPAASTTVPASTSTEGA